eukprot:7110648-Pyramimonas_sp.AAC.1
MRNQHREAKGSAKESRPSGVAPSKDRPQSAMATDDEAVKREAYAHRKCTGEWRHSQRPESAPVNRPTWKASVHPNPSSAHFRGTNHFGNPRVGIRPSNGLHRRTDPISNTTKFPAYQDTTRAYK